MSMKSEMVTCPHLYYKEVYKSCKCDQKPKFDIENSSKTICIFFIFIECCIIAFKTNDHADCCKWLNKKKLNYKN